jgi:hypothetical protein
VEAKFIRQKLLEKLLTATASNASTPFKNGDSEGDRILKSCESILGESMRKRGRPRLDNEKKYKET